jgi:hypothetical protein
MLDTSVLNFDEKFEIHLNSFLPALGNHLFNDPVYFRLHSNSARDCYAQLVNRSENSVYATISLHEIANDVYVSPGRGTFGGLSLNGASKFVAIEKFMHTVIDYLRRQGAESIRIRLAPASHDQALFALSYNALTRFGFRPDMHNVNYSMSIDERAFISRIDYGNVKRIRKASREGFTCERVDPSRLPEVYRLIAANRARMGVRVSMSLENLQQMVELFPERMQLFAVYRDASRHEMLAGAVCLELSGDIIYVLYWGDIDGLQSYSLAATLAASIYAFGAERGYKQLDVGISTLKGLPNYGLMNFKRNLGFTESIKLEMLWLRQSCERGD